MHPCVWGSVFAFYFCRSLLRLSPPWAGVMTHSILLYLIVWCSFNSLANNVEKMALLLHCSTGGQITLADPLTHWLHSTWRMTLTKCDHMDKNIFTLAYSLDTPSTDLTAIFYSSALLSWRVVPLNVPCNKSEERRPHDLKNWKCRCSATLEEYKESVSAQTKP